MKIQIILGSTRPGRAGEAVAKWALEVAHARNDAEFELVDVADVRDQLMLNLASDFENHQVFKPTEQHAQKLNIVLDQVVRWGGAFQHLRQ